MPEPWGGLSPEGTVIETVIIYFVRRAAYIDMNTTSAESRKRKVEKFAKVFTETHSHCYDCYAKPVPDRRSIIGLFFDRSDNLLENFLCFLLKALKFFNAKTQRTVQRRKEQIYGILFCAIFALFFASLR